MADTAELLSRLDGVRRTGHGRWMARCPAHSDGSPSLSIREADDGRTLLTCFAGCDAGAVVEAVGMTLKDLFPSGSVVAAHGSRTPVPAVDVLEAIEADALVVSIIAADLAKAGVVAPDVKAKLVAAAGRICAALEFCKEIRYDRRYRGI